MDVLLDTLLTLRSIASIASYIPRTIFPAQNSLFINKFVSMLTHERRAAAIFVRGHTKNSTEIAQAYCAFICFFVCFLIDLKVRQKCDVSFFHLMSINHSSILNFALFDLSGNFRGQPSSCYITAAMLRRGFHINEPTDEKEWPADLEM